MDRFLAQPRFQTALLSMFAAAGLLLAGMGLSPGTPRKTDAARACFSAQCGRAPRPLRSGLISFLVAGRTREIGVRIALGAKPGDVRMLVISAVAQWAASGIVAGTAGFFGVARLLQGSLYDIQPLEPRVLASHAH